MSALISCNTQLQSVKQLEGPIPRSQNHKSSYTHQRKFSSETSELRTNVTASCRTIMSTTSSCASDLCFFSGKVAVGGRRWRVSDGICFRGCAPGSGKWSTKSARDCSESSISHRNREKLSFFSDAFR